MRVLGIDPGATGAFALFVDGELQRIDDMPTVRSTKGRPRVDAGAVASVLRTCLPLDAAIIERVGARPGQGVTSMFQFGFAAGIVHGAVAALGVAMDEVSPGEWKVSLRVPASKHGARARASQLLPASAKLWPLAKHDGRAEAALIALWYVRKHRQQIEW